jgi:hypothetical protein
MVRNGQENFDMVPRDRACERASVRASRIIWLLAILHVQSLPFLRKVISISHL